MPSGARAHTGVAGRVVCGPTQGDVVQLPPFEARPVLCTCASEFVMA
jgi:hypothetical protein